MDKHQKVYKIPMRDYTPEELDEIVKQWQNIPIEVQSIPDTQSYFKCLLEQIKIIIFLIAMKKDVLHLGKMICMSGAQDLNHLREIAQLCIIKNY